MVTSPSSTNRPKILSSSGFVLNPKKVDTRIRIEVEKLGGIAPLFSGHKKEVEGGSKETLIVKTRFL